jgi:hypothetical protein
MPSVLQIGIKGLLKKVGGSQNVQIVGGKVVWKYLWICTFGNGCQYMFSFLSILWYPSFIPFLLNCYFIWLQYHTFCNGSSVSCHACIEKEEEIYA